MLHTSGLAGLCMDPTPGSPDHKRPTKFCLKECGLSTILSRQKKDQGWGKTWWPGLGQVTDTGSQEASKVRNTGFQEFQVWVLWPWAGPLASLTLIFLIWETGMIILMYIPLRGPW